MNYQNNESKVHWEILFSVVIPLLVAIGILILIGAADSLDMILFGR